MLLLVYSLPDVSFLFFNIRVSASVRGINHGVVLDRPDASEISYTAHMRHEHCDHLRQRPH